MKLIVGLGNPGKKYEKTRHNVGFMVLDAARNKWAEHADMSEWQMNKKFNAVTCGGMVDGEKIILVKPMTYMNASGQTVQMIGHFYKLTPEDIIVAHDDKDLPLGEIRVQENRGHAGHNGIRSIIQHIKSKKFKRIRLGIASDNERKMKNTAKFVLGKFGIFEKKQLQEMIYRGAEEINQLL